MLGRLRDLIGRDYRFGSRTRYNMPSELAEKNRQKNSDKQGLGWPLDDQLTENDGDEVKPVKKQA